MAQVKLEEYYEFSVFDKDGQQVGNTEIFSPSTDLTSEVERFLDYNPTYSVRVAVVRKDVMVFISTPLGITARDFG